MASLAVVESWLGVDPHWRLTPSSLQPTFNSNAIHLISGLLTITIGSFICSASTDSQRSQPVTHVLVKAAWTLCASIFLLIGFDAPVGDLHPIPCHILLGLTMIWLFVTFLRFLLGLVTDPDLFVAKLTILWKLVHVKRGTYNAKIRELHEKHGDLIRTGPNEYSLSNRAYFERCASFEKASPPLSPPGRTVQPEAYQLLHKALQMANIYSHEDDIDSCTLRLFQTFAKYAESGERVKLSDLIACYAYDVLYATTTGQNSGFLDNPVDAKKISTALDNWKSLSILYGSYLRVRPSIYVGIRALWPKANAERQILDHLDVDHAHQRSAAVQMLMARNDDENHAQRTTEACIALVLAGADPLITSLVTSLFYIYRDPKLLQSLRDEIQRAQLWQPPRIKYLMKHNARLPRLNAVLQESLRLQQPNPIDFSYVVPDGGVMIGEKHVPEGCTICLETSAAHVNPDIFGDDAEAWNPDRWLLDRDTAEQMRSHMLAFGAGPFRCPGQDYHVAVSTKFIAMLVPFINMELADEHFCTVPNDITFNELKERFVVKVSLPPAGRSRLATVSGGNTNTPALAPETTSAPELPPGLAPDAGTPNNFTLNPISIACAGYDGVGRFITALRSGKTFVPTSTNTSPEEVSNQQGRSPTFSNAPTLGPDHGVSDEDKAALGRLIGDHATALLLEKFPPASEVLVPSMSVKSWAIRDPSKRKAAHQMIDRIWEGRLKHQTREVRNRYHNNRLENRMFIELADPSTVRYNPAHSDHIAYSVPRRALPQEEINSAWGGFATTEETRHDEKVAEDKKSAQDAEKYAKEAAERLQKYNDIKATRESMPQAKFTETFKQTSRGHAGASKETSAVETPSIETEKPKTSVLPPHLRARVADPPPEVMRPDASSADYKRSAQVDEVERTSATNIDDKLPTQVDIVTSISATDIDAAAATQVETDDGAHVARLLQIENTKDSADEPRAEALTANGGSNASDSDSGSDAVSPLQVENMNKQLRVGGHFPNRDAKARYLDDDTHVASLLQVENVNNSIEQTGAEALTVNHDSKVSDADIVDVNASDSEHGGVTVVGGDGFVAARIPFF